MTSGSKVTRVRKYVDERLERHLCNLHNEVFEAAESRINTECSLTIREGISIERGKYIWVS